MTLVTSYKRAKGTGIEDPDQPVQEHSLIRIFEGRSVEQRGLILFGLCWQTHVLTLEEPKR